MTTAQRGSPRLHTAQVRVQLHDNLCGIARAEADGTRAETTFRLSPERTSPFKSARGSQFSRLLAAEVCASALVMLDTARSEVV